MTLDDIKTEITEKLKNRYVGTPHQIRFNYKHSTTVNFVNIDTECKDGYCVCTHGDYSYLKGLQEYYICHDRELIVSTYFIKNLKLGGQYD